MEQQPSQGKQEALSTQELAGSPEGQRIREGIAEALRDGSTIDQEIARLIAQAITPGSGAMHQLALTGEITPEIGGDLEVCYQLYPDLADTWIAALDGYCFRRRDKGPVVSWLGAAATGGGAAPDESIGSASDRSESLAGDAEAAAGGSGRLAGLEERLAPLPDLGEIPHPGSRELYGSGYEWMEKLPRGWHPEASWGRDGWDLGAWPLVAVALFEDNERELYAAATYVEGDVTAKRYRSRGALYVAVNGIAEFYWRLGQSRGPDDLPEGQGLLAHHCGPYSEGRR